jgi:hypothetical protein
MKKVIGIDRKIKRAWLDAALDRLARTTDADKLRQFVDEQLQEELPGKESRKKSVGIILRIWSGVPADWVRFRDRAVALLPTLTGQDRLWFHWGMTALAYPFFRDAAEVVGRLLTLQDEVTTAQVQARLLPTWGDRATTKEAAQKFLHTLVDWEVLRTGKTKGRFLLAKKVATASQPVQLWLLEALLAASAADEIEAQQLLRLPEAFPFSFTVGVADLRRHDGFDVHREGLDMEKVALRKAKEEQPAKPQKRAKKAKGTQDTTEQPSLFDRQPEEVASVNGVPHEEVGVPVIRATSEADGALGQQQVEESIREEVLRTLSERAARFLQVRGRQLVPDAPFAAPAAECARQFRDGHYYGCIALAQGVMEAIVRHVWQVKLARKKSQEGAFEKNLEALHKKKFITDEWKERLGRMWAERHTFHHLRPSVEQDQRRLEETARRNLKLLNELEDEFFGYSVRDGFIIPDHPEYWSIREGEMPVFVRG